MAERFGQVDRSTKVIDRVSQEHPYEAFENTPMWKNLERGIDDLARNGDLQETTDRRYIVGYLCKLLSETNAQA